MVGTHWQTPPLLDVLLVPGVPPPTLVVEVEVLGVPPAPVELVTVGIPVEVDVLTVPFVADAPPTPPARSNW